MSEQTAYTGEALFRSSVRARWLPVIHGRLKDIGLTKLGMLHLLAVADSRVPNVKIQTLVRTTAIGMCHAMLR